MSIEYKRNSSDRDFFKRSHSEGDIAELSSIAQGEKEGVMYSSFSIYPSIKDLDSTSTCSEEEDTSSDSIKSKKEEDWSSTSEEQDEPDSLQQLSFEFRSEKTLDIQEDRKNEDTEKAIIKYFKEEEEEEEEEEDVGVCMNFLENLLGDKEQTTESESEEEEVWVDALEQQYERDGPQQLSPVHLAEEEHGEEDCFRSGAIIYEIELDKALINVLAPLFPDRLKCTGNQEKGGLGVGSVYSYLLISYPVVGRVPMNFFQNVLMGQIDPRYFFLNKYNANSYSTDDPEKKSYLKSDDVLELIDDFHGRTYDINVFGKILFILVLKKSKDTEEGTDKYLKKVKDMGISTFFLDHKELED